MKNWEVDEGSEGIVEVERSLIGKEVLRILDGGFKNTSPVSTARLSQIYYIRMPKAINFLNLPLSPCIPFR